mmetsp:Transcript_15500/g.30453  ORF Transcript_15500/g.30453 Transcript_15500/m.30453 type:complete len:290 (-) Transcript_15500:132-1001(-)|eukprot:CAMPEP_0175103540 /NCGR_PEP_ID=MMETSP0086_2-20121207/9151_1 /TAXON_ID=136419 /ORGANISM="Unknown Unknown, Strain D1" /LENGTH=289 /DNA_ID=CAMNT_0016378677 /DNA_START=54 /DNA_END=923 /DNA_ORIENTATION=-
MTNHNNYAVNLKAVKALKNQGTNKQCVECGAPSLYVVTLYGHIFVCHNCAGIHRIHVSGRFVKGLTTANFSEADVKGVQHGGNDANKRFWLANYSSSSLPLPTRHSTLGELKAFVAMKYITKAWCEDGPENYSLTSKICTTPPATTKSRQNSTCQNKRPDVQNSSSSGQARARKVSKVTLKVTARKPNSAVKFNGGLCTEPCTEPDFFADWEANISNVLSAPQKSARVQQATSQNTQGQHGKLDDSKNQDRCQEKRQPQADLLDFSWFDSFDAATFTAVQSARGAVAVR